MSEVQSYTTFCFERAASRYAIRVRYLRRIREGMPGETAHDPGVGGLVTLAGGERVAELEGGVPPVQVGAGTKVQRYLAPEIHEVPAFLEGTAQRRGWASLLHDPDGEVRVLLSP